VILEALSCGVGIVVTEKLKGTYDDFEKLSVLRYTRLDHDSISKNMQEMAARINEIRSNHCSVHKLIVEKHDVSKITKLLLDELNNKYLNFWKDDSFH
jgi:glycosyltransferase involved in cell wall biosynthesis